MPEAPLTQELQREQQTAWPLPTVPRELREQQAARSPVAATGTDQPAAPGGGGPALVNREAVQQAAEEGHRRWQGQQAAAPAAPPVMPSGIAAAGGSLQQLLAFAGAAAAAAMQAQAAAAALQHKLDERRACGASSQAFRIALLAQSHAGAWGLPEAHADPRQNDRAGACQQRKRRRNRGGGCSAVGCHTCVFLPALPHSTCPRARSGFPAACALHDVCCRTRPAGAWPIRSGFCHIRDLWQRSRLI